MISRLAALLLLALAALLPSALAAQQPPEEAPAASEPAPGVAETDALIRLLRDDAAREALIARLEQAAAEAPAAATGAVETAPAIEEAGISLGRRIAEVTQAAAQDVAGAAVAAWNAVLNAPRRLSGLEGAADPDVLVTAARELGLAILATYGTLLLLRFAARPLRRRIAGEGVESGLFRTLVLGLFVSLLDALIVLVAWAVGYAIVTFLIGEATSLGLRQTLYLNAFVAVEIARIVIRLVLRPESGHLRLINIPDAGARLISARLAFVSGLLGYGLLLAAPIVRQEAGWRAGQATSTAISLLAVLVAVVAVLRHRSAVARWLAPADPTSRRSFAALARLWHIPVLVYLAFLFFIVLARPGDVLWPVLEASGKILVAVLVGMMVNGVLARRARAGVRVPPRVAESLPLLERRLNAFVPKALFVLRILVIAAVVAAALQITGLWNAEGWLASGIGAQLAGSLASVALILLGAFLVWVAFASWVDWRLNPEVGRPPTSRETTLLSLLRNAGAIALIVVTLMFALSELGLDIAPLLASAGVLGLAIGFGAQRLVQDVITGVFIQLENAMNVGDVVTANATTGVVEKLTIRSVSLRDLEGVFHVIPFSSVDMVSNYMRDFSYCVVDMGIAYREDIEEAKQAMLDAFAELRADPEFGAQILADLEWFGLNAFGDSAIVLRARIKTLPGKQWGIGRAYNGIIKRIFDERGIEIPFPHQTIYFGEDKRGKAPPLHLVRDDASGRPAAEPGAPSAAPASNAAARRPAAGEDMPESPEHAEDRG